MHEKSANKTTCQKKGLEAQSTDEGSGVQGKTTATDDVRGKK